MQNKIQPEELLFPVMWVSSKLESPNDSGACSSVHTINARQSMQPCCAFEIVRGNLVAIRWHQYQWEY